MKNKPIIEEVTERLKSAYRLGEISFEKYVASYRAVNEEKQEKLKKEA